MSLPDLVHVDHEFFFMQLSCAWQFLLDQGDFPLRNEVLTYTFRVANNSPVSHYAFSARKFVRVQDSWAISDLSVLYTTRISTRNIRQSSIRGDTYHSFQSILVFYEYQVLDWVSTLDRFWIGCSVESMLTFVLPNFF